MERALPAPVAAPAAAVAPEAVLVMVDGGQYRELYGVATDALLRMGVTELLITLRQDREFAEQLAGVVLNKCRVTVAVSASEEAPSAAEEATGRELKGVVSLHRLAAAVLAAEEQAAAAAAGGRPFYLYARVRLQAPHAGAGGGGGSAHQPQQPQGE